MNNKSMSDWILSARKQGINDLNDFDTNKIKDYQRLKDFGLPVFDDFLCSSIKFSDKNKGLMKFLEKYSSFVIRAIPNSPNSPRRHKVGVHSFEECLDFLNEINARKSYNILLTEHEPTNKGGIIISKISELIIELGKNIEILEHGGDPTTSWFIDLTKPGYLRDKIIEYRKASEIDKQILNRALNYIDLNQTPFNSRFMRGYFEFVVTSKNNKIRFLDYKINEKYLK
ncbi:MAG: hypothetical protein WC438_01085 [Candidatus Pacearchaeota archaeon]